jgi:toxin ParE1/3/4
MARIKLNWTNAALHDLDSIFDHIALDSPIYARSFTQRLIDTVSRLQIAPLSGRRVPEADDPQVREVLFENYRIIYWLLDEKHLDILGVVHGKRDLRQNRNQPW